MEIKWLDKPHDSSFDAALSYLTLLLGNVKAEQHFAAKDILRAAQTQALPAKKNHVVLNIKKIKSEQEIGPVLLCRHKGHLIIADGFHRISAAWRIGEDTLVHTLVT
jgi:hypothetical protein